MSPFSIYVIDEEILFRLELRFAELGATMACNSAKYLQNDGLTMYQDWVVTFENGVRVVMWGKHPVSRLENDKSLQLTVGSPDGKRGLAALASAEKSIVDLGGVKL